MTSYTQDRQAMRVHTALEEDLLLLEGLTGEEAVSRPFLYELDFVSLDRDIDGATLLRSPVRVDLDLPDGTSRPIHGIIRRFVQRGRDEDLISYRAEIVPWLWFLSLAQDCRIFQDMDVLEIVEKVFKGQGYSDFDVRCTRTYEKREYCVQYRESNLDFVSRLLEEHGIFYFFEHEDSRHVLVLADDVSAIRPCAGQEEARMHSQPVPDEDVVLTMEREHTVHPGQVTFADYDYLQPSLSLRSTVAGEEPEEVYDYPGGFKDLEGGDQRARLALEREEALRHVVRGTGTCRAFRAGGDFKLVDHFDDGGNQTYVILELRHRARNGSYRAKSGVGGFEYRNELVAIPRSVPYRPQLRTRKPVVRGAQTAEVVGPSGEDIWVDEYGRVKVQFPWDREGARDDNSSCWVRVSQNWAGRQWGGMFIPHVGQEVIVEFLEGDPDHPIITGRVYHAANMPPMKLPQHKHKSIIRDDFGNEIVFDSTPGDEHLSIHSPRHSSTLDIGRSIEAKSSSDTLSTAAGDEYKYTVGNWFTFGGGIKGDIYLGTKLGLFAGLKADVDLAAKLSLGVGVSASISWAGKYEYARSFSYTNVKGKSLTATDGGIVQASKKGIRIDSQEEVKIVGGSKLNSMITGKTRELLLQFGSGVRTDSQTHNRDARNAMLLSVISGVLASAGATAATIGIWATAKKSEAESKLAEGTLPEEEVEKNRELAALDRPTLAGLYTLGLVTLGGYITTAVMGGVSSNKEGPQTNTAQKKTDAQISLDDQGVMLEAFKGKTPKASLNVSNVKGEVTVNADEQIEMKNAKKVILSGSSEIQLKSKKIRMTKGSTWTKNIKDTG